MSFGKAKSLIVRGAVDFMSEKGLVWCDFEGLHSIS
jgi:hypothetical protein